MRKNTYRSYNAKINSKNIEGFLSSRSLKINKKIIPIKNSIEQILFERKFSLDVLLKTIKSFQFNFFSKLDETNKLFSLKQMLIALKDNLSLMNVEKMKKFESLKNINENTKNEIQETLFEENHNKNKENSNESYIKQKNELQFINFQIENDIQKTNFLIDQKYQINLYLKSIPFFFDNSKEIFCNNNYENLENISDILQNITRSVRDKFISVVKEKMETELEINSVNYKINSIKDNKSNVDQLNSQKKYIDTEEIIYEETKENNKTLITNQSKRNSYASLHKLSTKKAALGNLSSKNLVKKRTSIDSILRENIHRNISLYNKLNDIYHKNNNQINNYLNMNINVNINLNNNGINKYCYSTSSLDDEATCKSDEYEEQYEIQLDENNKIVMTPIQTEENINNDDEELSNEN